MCKHGEGEWWRQRVPCRAGSNRRCDRCGVMRWTLLGVILVSTAIAADVTDAAEPRAKVTAGNKAKLSALVEQLGTPSYQERKTASKALTEAGTAAIPLLVSAVEHSDPEVRHRAISILQHFSRSKHVDLGAAGRRALQLVAQSENDSAARLGAAALRQFIVSAIAKLERKGAKVDVDDHGNVRSVNFTRKKIADSDLQPLVELRHLKTLDLRFTPISNAGLAYVKELTTLETLNLQATRVTDDGLRQLQSLTNMQKFSVERTAVTDDGLEYLTPFSRLETLYLGGSQVTGPGLEHLQHLEQLVYLSFEDSTITDDAVDGILSLSHLRTLGLDGTQVTDACLPKLAALDDLRVLWLNKAHITDRGVTDLAALVQLTELHVKGTRISPDGIEQLKKALPNTRIFE